MLILILLGNKNKNHYSKKRKKSWAWWCTLLVPDITELTDITGIWIVKYFISVKLADQVREYGSVGKPLPSMHNILGPTANATKQRHNKN